MWREVDSAKVLVRSNLDADDLQTQVTQLEQLLQTMQWVLDDTAPLKPVELVLVHSGDLGALGHDDIAGMVHGDRGLTLIEAGSLSRQVGTSAHELAHVVILRTMPTTPRWLHEGLATYLETAQFKGLEQVKLGTGIYRYQAIVLGDRLSTSEELWAWGQGPEPTGDAWNRLYASGWGVVHYLMNHDRARFNLLMQRLRQSHDPRRAFEAVFPDFDAVVVPAVREHLNGGDFMSLTLTLRAPPVRGRVRELTPGEVHRARAEIVEAAFRLAPEERRRRAGDERAVAERLEPGRMKQPSAPVSKKKTTPVPPLESVLQLSLDEPELRWTKRALDRSVDRPAEASALIDEGRPVKDIQGLRNIWAAAAVLGDCERLGRVHALSAAFEATNPDDVAAMQRRWKNLCGELPAPPAFKCAGVSSGYPDEAFQTLWEPRAKAMGSLVGAVDAVEDLEELRGELRLVLRDDGSIDVTGIDLEPSNQRLIIGLARLLERFAPLPKPCSGKGGEYGLPLSFKFRRD